jgi:hypothetical protein
MLLQLYMLHCVYYNPQHCEFKERNIALIYKLPDATIMHQIPNFRILMSSFLY